VDSSGVVIVAAGQGTRLGLGPKGLIEVEGETLVARLAKRAIDAGMSRIVAVLPPGVPCPLPGLDFTTNEVPESGPLGSVIAGLSAMEAAGPITGLIIWPVDHPFVGYGQLRALAHASTYALEDWSRIVPCWDGRRGHPIWVCPAGLGALRQITDATTTTLRAVLAGAGATQEIEATSGAVLQNMNRPGAMIAASTSSPMLVPKDP
jgi:CTP:molybdopterin cytidylyltransferase MocA